MIHSLTLWMVLTPQREEMLTPQREEMLTPQREGRE